MEESVLEEGTMWVQCQKGEKCDTIEEVEIMSGDLEGANTRSGGTGRSMEMGSH